MSNFEQVCNQLNQRIRIGKDKSVAINLADNVLAYITNEMKSLDGAFKSMYRGPKISGSYADDLKISKPNEFDFLLRIKLPQMNNFKLQHTNHGYMSIDASMLNAVKPSPSQREVVERVKEFLSPDGYLLKDPFAMWIHYMLDDVFRKLRKFNDAKGTYELCLPAAKCQLSRKRNGPAHTLNVKVDRPPMEFDIDMVFVLEISTNDQWMSERPRPNQQMMSSNWHLVPKPNGLDDDKNWISSYAEIERMHLNGKDKMKNLIRIFKKIRDTQSLSNLKSFFIKTVFLLQDDIVPRNYWRQNMQTLFFEMLDRIEHYLSVKHMPFYWHRQYNMLGKMTDAQMNDLLSKWRRINQRLRKAVEESNWDAVMAVILTEQERKNTMDTKCNDLAAQLEFCVIEDKRSETVVKPAEPIANSQTTSYKPRYKPSETVVSANSGCNMQ